MQKDLIIRYAKLPTGNIADANNKGGNMDSGIKPIDLKSKLVGPAYTVRCHPADNLTIHKAILEAPEGSVLVVDAAGYRNCGHFGEITALACQINGISGLVIDGGCRDAEEIAEMGFPVFCRALNPGGTVKKTMGTTNVIVECGGKTVHPGDLIVGDRDGVVVIAAAKIQEVLEKAEAIAAKEIHVKELLKQGKTTVEIYNM